MCFCSRRYPAFKAHAPYYVVICSLSGSTVFFHIISQSVDDFERKLSDVKCVFDCTDNKFALKHFSVEEEFGDIIS